jgi:hypothetical protein
VADVFEADVFDEDDPDDFEGPAPLADRPTDADPGSPGKVAALEQRAAQCVGLFHPDDGAGPAALPRDPAELFRFLHPQRKTWGRRARSHRARPGAGREE